MLNLYFLLAENSNFEGGVSEIKLAKMFLYIFFAVLMIVALVYAAKHTEALKPHHMTDEEEMEYLKNVTGGTSFTKEGLKYLENMKGRKPSASEKGVTEDLLEDIGESISTRFPKKERARTETRKDGKRGVSREKQRAASELEKKNKRKKSNRKKDSRLKKKALKEREKVQAQIEKNRGKLR